MRHLALPELSLFQGNLVFGTTLLYARIYRLKIYGVNLQNQWKQH